MKDIKSTCGALYDGGWRAGDKIDLIREYEFTEDEAEEVCKELARIRSRYVIDENGNEICFCTAVQLMDDDIREELLQKGLTTSQSFFDAYCLEHKEIYGEDFRVN